MKIIIEEGSPHELTLSTEGVSQGYVEVGANEKIVIIGIDELFAAISSLKHFESLSNGSLNLEE